MQVVIQTADVAVAVLLAAAGTFVILKVISLFTALRVSDEIETAGLDLNLHGETAYHAYETGGEAAVPSGYPGLRL